MDMEQKKIEEILDLLEKPVISYIQALLKWAGIDASEQEAGNALSNIGLNRYKKSTLEEINKTRSL